ncbi:MAG: preprotein translocase subunit SecY [Ruminococcaceae bacterium]|nr:preprotein translocase subunit SecY [Oscillospiraceae bacterium]
MFQTLKNAWKIPELKSKLLFTLFIVILYRIGANIPMPWVQTEALGNWFGNSGGNAFTWLNLLSGSALSRGTLFALSVSPYITASIVVQLLTIAFKKLADWQKDGERGRKKLSNLTRSITVGLALITSIGYAMFLSTYGWLTYTSANPGAYWLQMITLVVCFCAGASLIMWLAERINEYGIGNGISIILFANIIARLPSMVGSLSARCFQNEWKMFAEVANGKVYQYIIGAALCLLFAAVLLFFTVLVIWFSNSERRIPVQYAKRVVGRKMYGGQSSNLPIKLDMTGVMPIIFSSSIVSILPTVAGFIPNTGFGKFVNDYLGMNSFPYLAIYLILVVAFAYFYVMISFNPVEVANNLQNNGGAIPGIRPGRPTVAYITKILNRITLLGALFLCVLSGVPMIVNAIWYAIDGVGLADLAFSGSSLLIVVGVALETYRQLEAQMTLRNYKGFLD